MSSWYESSLPQRVSWRAITRGGTRRVLNLAEAVDHERDQLDAAEAGDLVLSLEALEQEREQLRDQARRGSVVVLVVVLGLLALLLLRICSRPSQRPVFDPPWSGQD